MGGGGEKKRNADAEKDGGILKFTFAGEKGRRAASFLTYKAKLVILYVSGTGCLSFSESGRSAPVLLLSFPASEFQE